MCVFTCAHKGVEVKAFTQQILIFAMPESISRFDCACACRPDTTGGQSRNEPQHNRGGMEPDNKGATDGVSDSDANPYS